MTKKARKEVKSVFFTKKTIDLLDDKKPVFSMNLLAFEIIKNCFNQEYMFRTDTMKRRFKQHGVLPKSFFRQNFQRSTKLLALIQNNEMTLDLLTDQIIEDETRFEKVELFDRKENKIFYRLIKGSKDGGN